MIHKYSRIRDEVKYLLKIFSILLLTSCISREDDVDTAHIAPVVAEVSAISTPTRGPIR